MIMAAGHAEHVFQNETAKVGDGVEYILHSAGGHWSGHLCLIMCLN